MEKCRVAISQAEEKVYRVIDGALKQYYSEFSPDEYIRTQKLLHSLVKSNVKRVGNGYEAEVYFDGSKLNYQTGVIPTQHGTGYATWGAEEVLDTAMHGSHGGYIDGIAIWGTSKAVLGDIYVLIKKELIAQGIPIK
ncbi:MAG: hypothetical protein J6R59_09670 [Paludibacteraceae bacterium]|nr:hypothetical protein [Paludibacteraceae bacterium]